MEIIRLLPEQIMLHWHFIRDSMIRSFPPIAEATNESFLAIQQQCLIGEIDVWFAIDSLESEAIYAVMTTKVVHEDVTNTKNMLIFSLTTHLSHDEDLWKDGYSALGKYAKAKGCKKIISFTNNIQVLRIAERLGADTSWYLVQLEID